MDGSPQKVANNMSNPLELKKVPAPEPIGWPTTLGEAISKRDAALEFSRQYPDKYGQQPPEDLYKYIEKLTGFIDIQSAKAIETPSTVPSDIRMKMGMWNSPKIKQKLLTDKYGADNVQVQPSGEILYREIQPSGSVGLWRDAESPGVLDGGDFMQFVGSSPQYIASGVGGILASPGGPAASVVGGGLTYTMGQLLQRKAAETVSGVELENLTEKQVQRMGAEAMLAELTGTTIVGGLSRALKPRGKALTEKSLELLELGKKYDIPWQPTDIIPEGNLPLLEGTLDKMIGGRGYYQKAAEKRIRGFGRLKEAEGKKIKQRAMGAWETGDIVSANLKEAWTAFQKNAGPMYQKISDAAGGARAPYPKIQAFVKELEDISGTEKLVDPQILRRLRNIVKEEPGEKGKDVATKPFMRLYEIRKALVKDRQTREVVDRGGYRAYTQAIQAIDQDMSDFATKSELPEVIKASTEARKYYASQMENFGNKFVERFQKSGQDLERLASTIYTGKSTPNILALKNIFQEYSPEAWDDVTRYVLSELFDRSKVEYQFASGMVETISPAKLTKQINGFGKEKLAAILDADQLAYLDLLQEGARRLGAAEVLAGNPSGTGQIVLTGRMIQDLAQKMAPHAPTAGAAVGGAAGGLSGAAWGIAATVGTTAGLAKFMTSPFGRRWLIQGFNLPARRFINRGTVLGAQMGIKDVEPLKEMWAED